MKVGVIIPDRGDRPLFTENCRRMLDRQTLKPDEILWMNYKPESNNCDITQRYRRGYDHFRNKGFDVIAFLENDDWYASDYLEVMINKWVQIGKPEMIGTNYTIYYNIHLFAYFTMHHTRRGPAMSMLIKPDMNFTWSKDDQPYTDSFLWFCSTHLSSGKKLQGLCFKPDHHICIGIKHGVGLTGGQTHTTELYRYSNQKGNKGVQDPDKIFLQTILDPESFSFYSNYFNHAKTSQQIQAHA